MWDRTLGSCASAWYAVAASLMRRATASSSSRRVRNPWISAARLCHSLYSSASSRSDSARVAREAEDIDDCVGEREFSTYSPPAIEFSEVAISFAIAWISFSRPAGSLPWPIWSLTVLMYSVLVPIIFSASVRRVSVACIRLRSSIPKALSWPATSCIEIALCTSFTRSAIGCFAKSMSRSSKRWTPAWRKPPADAAAYSAFLTTWTSSVGSVLPTALSKKRTHRSQNSRSIVVAGSICVSNSFARLATLW